MFPTRFLLYLVIDLAGAGGNNYVHIGLNDRDVEGTWVISSSGELPSYINWYPGEPNGDAAEDCVILTNFGPGPHWYDVTCNGLYYVICEREL